MRFSFTEDQRMLRDTVREVLTRECAPDVVRAAWDGDVSGARSVWGTLAETGVIGMRASEEAGGLGMSELDLVLPLEETGYAALPGPVVETAAVAVPLLDACNSDASRALLKRVVSGEATVTVAFGGRALVSNVDTSDVVLVQHDDGAYAVPVAELSLTRETSVDRTRGIATLVGEPSEGHLLARGDAIAEAFCRAFASATLATAAQLVGLTRRMLDMAVQYAKDREQFGKPIGVQQAVKHRLANALIQQEFARPLVYRAAWSLAHQAPDRDLHVSMAKIYAGEAARFVAKQALQVHGAIGYTIECDLHMWMKRAWALAAEYGDTGTHIERIGEHIL